MPLTHPIADGDGVKLQGNPPSLANAPLGRFRKLSQMNMPGNDFIPGIDHGYERFLEVGGGKTIRIEDCPVGGPLQSFV
jgi:hypothetical protein